MHMLCTIEEPLKQMAKKRKKKKGKKGLFLMVYNSNKLLPVDF